MQRAVSSIIRTICLQFRKQVEKKNSRLLLDLVLVIYIIIGLLDIIALRAFCQRPQKRAKGPRFLRSRAEQSIPIYLSTLAAFTLVGKVDRALYQLLLFKGNYRVLYYCIDTLKYIFISYYFLINTLEILRVYTIQAVSSKYLAYIFFISTSALLIILLISS